ncbi:MAG: lysylphosphatidylglycerol synthase transmembrane domain-containing protein [Candidatus Aenigmatarchaeota archaeon]
MKLLNISKKEVFKKSLAFFVSGFLLFLIFNKIEIEKVYKTLIKSNLYLVLITLIISFFVNIVLGTYKWNRILYILGFSLPFREALNIRCGFLPFKLIFPLKTPELIKAFYLEKKKNIPILKAISSLITDRVFNLIATLSIFLVGLIFVRMKLNFLFPFSLLLFLFAFVFLNFPRKILLKISKLINVKIYQFTLQVLSGLMDLNFSQKFILTFYSFLYQLSEFINTYLLFKAVGLEISFWLICIFIPLVIVINNLPITVLGLGTREALLIFLFSNYGAKELILSAGLLVSLIEHIFPVLVGIFFIRKIIR